MQNVSFSSLIKNELCRIEINNNCCLVSELAAVVRMSGVLNYSGENYIGISIATENAPFARKLFSLIKKLYNVYPHVTIRRSSKLKKHVLYLLDIASIPDFEALCGIIGINYNNQHVASSMSYQSYADTISKSECCKKAYIRGAFLAAGSISDPEKTYHLEITIHKQSLAEELCGIINSFGLNSKVITRKSNFVVYLKEGEDIVDFLNIIGAHKALMEFENVRILKEMRNNVNRVVNCETANLQKTVDASIRQVENIKYIRDNIGFDNIPENLREIAELRLEYSDANLKELGEMLSPPLGKSGVNHRLRKLDEIAKDHKADFRKIKYDIFSYGFQHFCINLRPYIFCRMMIYFSNQTNNKCISLTQEFYLQSNPSKFYLLFQRHFQHKK